MPRIYGVNAVRDLLGGSPTAIERVLIGRGARSADVDRLVADLEAASIPWKEVDPASLRERSGGRGGSSIGADLRMPPRLDVGDIEAHPAQAGGPIVVALDGVTDPHNLGAVMRSAAAFEATAVIVTKDRSAPLTDAAVRASAGGVAHCPLIRVVNLSRALRQLRDQGLWVVGTDVGGEQTLWERDLTVPTALVLGAEGYGIRPGVLKACDVTVRLPLPGPVGSLNVSVFAGIALAEAGRQRGATGS